MNQSQDDNLRQAGKTIARQSWSHIAALSNLKKLDYSVSKRDTQAANAMVREFTMENPNPSAIETIGWFRIIMLTLQIRQAANRHMLMSGESIEDGDMTREEFQKRKDAERKLIPQLDKQLADALLKTGDTRQQKKIDDSIVTSAEAAAMVYAKYKVDGDH